MGNRRQGMKLLETLRIYLAGFSTNVFYLQGKRFRRNQGREIHLFTGRINREKLRLRFIPGISVVRSRAGRGVEERFIEFEPHRCHCQKVEVTSARRLWWERLFRRPARVNVTVRIRRFDPPVLPDGQEVNPYEEA